MEALTIKYRPADWKFVIGQDAVVRSMRQVLEKRTNHSFLLSGPSGTGKTTIARIAAKQVGCEPNEIMEHNAARFTGIDDMRVILESISYRPIGGKVRVIIMDECHRLSAGAFNSLLKTLEEPPKWLWWFLCTTEFAKVPETIKTRCTRYNLKAVSRNELLELLDEIVRLEKIELGANEEDQDAILELCVREARGSPRMALTNLGACATARDRNEARSLLQALEQESQGIDLARALMQGTKWDQLQELLAGLREENPEGVRHVVRAYMTNAILAGKVKNLSRCFAVLELFSQPFPSSDGISPLVLACGKLLFAQD